MPNAAGQDKLLGKLMISDKFMEAAVQIIGNSFPGLECLRGSGAQVQWLTQVVAALPASFIPASNDSDSAYIATAVGSANGSDPELIASYVNGHILPYHFADYAAVSATVEQIKFIDERSRSQRDLHFHLSDGLTLNEAIALYV